MECLAKNAEREKDRRFCRHDYRHMADVAKISYNMLLDSGDIKAIAAGGMLAGPKAALEVVYAAGLLHDIARWIQYDSGEDHALAGARLARGVMERAGFNLREAALVQRAIREHRRAGQGASLLGKTLCLADDLARPCTKCEVRMDCYKIEQMERIKGISLIARKA
jgi:HD superfamily phosphodiesterase